MKIVKPFIERPFIPTEVDSIAALAPKPRYNNQSSMTNALLVGPKQRSNGEVDENPTMYSTVIERHATVITHPMIQPMSSSVTSTGAQSLSNGMNPSPPSVEMDRLSPGAYSIPVKIQGGAINDPTLSGYESPKFIETKEKILPGAEGVALPDVGATLTVTSADDVKEFTAKLGAAHNKEEKLETLQEGKKKLAAEVEALKSNIQKEIDSILQAKEVSVLLHNLLIKYEAEINNQRDSQFKIADQVTLKNLLKEKLYKEIQGFRTSSSEYEELNKVKPEDINDVISQIKQKLG